MFWVILFLYSFRRLEDTGCINVIVLNILLDTQNRRGKLFSSPLLSKYPVSVPPNHSQIRTDP